MSPIKLGLILLASIAAIICFRSAQSVSRVPQADTRHGLRSLLLLSGAWAIAEVGRLLLATAALKAYAYIIGSVVGLATVGAWLYFCSAYTGYEYHRNRDVRRIALTIYIGIILVKLTNPYHHLYFTSTLATQPFPHLKIYLGVGHWVVTGLAYALTAIGFYLLYDMFSRSKFDTRALSLLVLIAGLPAILDIFSYTGHLILTFNYEPLGVAAFAIGVLYFVDEQFVTLPPFWESEIIQQIDEVVLVFDYQGRLRDYNNAAIERFPELEAARNERIDVVYPDLADALASENEVVELDSLGTTRYYLLNRTPLATEQAVFGRVVILTDVTVVEHQRREVQRQNDQFDDFAEAITHELRNTLAIAEGYITTLGDELESESSNLTKYHHRATEALTRMERIIDDLAALAQYGQTIETTQKLNLQEAIEEACKEANVDLRCSVERGGTLRGEPTRVRELFRNWLLFAAAIDASEVTVSLDGTVLTLSTDGESLTDEELNNSLEYGEAVPSAAAGMYLPNLRTLAQVHGWSVDPDLTYTDGVRLRLTDLTTTHISTE